jgi:hypothetical protein
VCREPNSITALVTLATGSFRWNGCLCHAQ